MQERSLPPFTEFQRAIEAAHPEMRLKTSLLGKVYRLAEQRIEYERESESQIEAAAKIRKMISQSRAQVRKLRAIESDMEDVRSRLDDVGFHSQRFHELFHSIQGEVRSLMELLEAAQQDGIDQIFPTRAHGLAPKKWETFNLSYDLPRLGERAAYSWFVLSMDTMLVAWCKRNKRRLKKRVEWEILQTVLHKLFQEEGIETNAIERLVRDARKGTKKGRMNAEANT